MMSLLGLEGCQIVPVVRLAGSHGDDKVMARLVF